MVNELTDLKWVNELVRRYDVCAVDVIIAIEVACVDRLKVV